MFRQAAAGNDHRVYFQDGTIHLLNVKLLIQKGSICSPLQDIDFFRERLTVINGTVARDMDGTRDPCICVDLDPCELYETCLIVEDPLKDVG